MKRLPLGAMSALAMLSVAISLAANAETWTAKCLSVVDGDTINVAHNNTKERVIFYGIDCPEIDQPGGEEARKFTDAACYRKNVTLEDHGHDSKGRTVAVVYLPDGTNLNEELVRQGWAWWSDKYAPGDTKLKALHIAAQAAHKGLWAAPNPIPPWIWRNGQRNVQSKLVPSN